MTDNIDIRRKQMLYRANHRGIKEMDIILGGYADAYINEMDVETLDEFEKIMSELDRDLLTWFTQEVPIPEHMDTPLFHKVLAHTVSKY